MSCDFFGTHKGRERPVSRGQFYLDKSNAKLAGVCAGLADYTGVDVFWIRLGAVVLTLLGFWLTIPVYIAAMVLANKRPNYLYSPEEEERLLHRMERRRARQGRSTRLRSEITDMDRRVADLEAHYTSSNARLAAEIESLR